MPRAGPSLTKMPTLGSPRQEPGQRGSKVGRLQVPLFGHKSLLQSIYLLAHKCGRRILLELCEGNLLLKRSLGEILPSVGVSLEPGFPAIWLWTKRNLALASPFPLSPLPLSSLGLGQKWGVTVLAGDWTCLLAPWSSIKGQAPPSLSTRPCLHQTQARATEGIGWKTI